MVHAPVAIGKSKKGVKVIGVPHEGLVKICDPVFKGLELPVTVTYGGKNPYVHAFPVRLDHLFPIKEGVPVFLKIVMQMTQTDDGIGVLGLHFEDPQIHRFGMFKVPHFTVRVGYPGQDGDVFIVVKEILLPDFYGPVKLIERLITVRQPEKGIVVPRMMDKASLVIGDGIPEISPFPCGVPYAYQGIVVVLVNRQYLVKAIQGFGNFIFLEILIAPFRKIRYFD
jgi:hypothetical protein